MWTSTFGDLHCQSLPNLKHLTLSNGQRRQQEISPDNVISLMGLTSLECLYLDLIDTDFDINALSCM